MTKMGGQFLDFVAGHSCYEGDIELIGGPGLQQGQVKWRPVKQEQFNWLSRPRALRARKSGHLKMVIGKQWHVLAKTAFCRFLPKR